MQGRNIVALRNTESIDILAEILWIQTEGAVNLRVLVSGCVI